MDSGAHVDGQLPKGTAYFLADDLDA